MDEWLEILIFVIVIIANIIGGIIKTKKKLKEKKLEQSPVDNEDEYYEEEFEEDEYVPEIEFQQTAPATVSAVKNIPFPETTAANAPCHECPPCKNEMTSSAAALEVIDNDDENDDNFDYGEFMHTHGREAFILAEIILPANSRQGS